MRALGVSSILFIFSLLGCSSSRTEPPAQQGAVPGNAAPGILLIDILESGHPERYWQYEVQPSAGLVRKVREETFSDYAHEKLPHAILEPVGSIGSCSDETKAASPHGKYLAYCRARDWGLFVSDEKSAKTLCFWKPQEWRAIRGFGWASNSQSVAVLNASSYYGKSPLELLSGLVGHPVPHDTIFLDVLDVHTGAVTEYLVRRNVPYSFARILKWSE